MDDLERRQTETIWRVGNFGAENTDAVRGNIKAVAAFAAVQTAISELEAVGITRTSAGDTKLGKSARRKFQRSELYDDLSLIARTSVQIKRDNDDFDNKYLLPQTNRSDLVWLETARAFAADLVADKSLFIEYGIAADFIEDLNADADAFETTINEQDSSNRERVGANAAIDDTLDDALKAIRTLKIIIPNIFKGNPAKLADWISASHIEKAPKKKKAEPEKPPTA